MPGEPTVDAEQLQRRATAIVRRLREAGHRALFAGGCVRDRLLGRPINDVDIATSARPEQVQALFRNTIAVGAAFGVIVVVDRRKDEPTVQFEVATFRTDGDYGDGRRPDSVTFCDDREDALRRDFTINALFWDPVDEAVIDHVGGVADIEARVVRAVGKAEERFAEDHLRLLRAPRFAARLGFDLDEATGAAARAVAPKVATVSAERIHDELSKILRDRSRRRGLEMCHDLGLLAVVLPEVTAMEGVAQPPEHHPEGCVWTHTLILLEKMGPAPSEALAWGGLLHDIGKPPTFAVKERIRFDGHAEKGAAMADEILLRLRFPNKVRERVVMLVRQHQRFIDASRMKTSTLKRFLRQDGFEELLELHRLDCLASHGRLESWELCRRKLEELGAADEAGSLRPPPLVTGGDLKRWGLAPGPLFKRILTAVEDAQLEGEIDSAEQAEALVRREFPEAFGSSS